MTKEQVFLWAKRAKSGASIVYRTGQCLSHHPTQPRFAPAVHAVRELYNQGVVDLFQRRLSHGGDSEFDYIAVKREEATPPAYAACIDGTPKHLFNVPEAYRGC